MFHMFGMTFIRLSFNILALLIFCCLPCFGESVSVSITGLQISPTTSSDLIQHIKPVFVKVKSSTIRLHTRRLFNTTSRSTFLQGQHRKMPVAASIINGELQIVFPGKATGSRHSRQRLYTLRTIAKNGKSISRLSSIPASVLANKTCGSPHTTTNDHADVKTVPSIKEGMPVTSTHVVTIHTYADPEWEILYGSKSSDTILQMINEAEAIYERQLQVRFRVVGHTVLRDMTPITTPGGLLGEFRNNTSSQDAEADIKYLFTGKDLQGSTIGIAFVSALCFEPTYAYGLSQSYYGGGFLLAHEIGHIFGAMHDTTSYGIMYPSILLNGTGEFSQTSLTQINQHLMNYGSCLSLEPLPPNLTNSKLTLVRSGRVLRGVITSIRNIPIANVKIAIIINNKKVFVKTNSRGQYTYRIPKAKKRTYLIYATTEKGEAQSDTLWGRF